MNSGLNYVPNITDLFLISGVKQKGGDIVLKCGRKIFRNMSKKTKDFNMDVHGNFVTDTQRPMEMNIDKKD